MINMKPDSEPTFTEACKNFSDALRAIFVEATEPFTRHYNEAMSGEYGIVMAGVAWFVSMVTIASFVFLAMLGIIGAIQGA